MRLKNTLQEAAEFEMVVKDIHSKMYELFRVLKKNNFQMDDKSLEKSLDAIFKDKGIGFQIGRKRISSFSHVIQSGGMTDDLFIVIEYVPGFSKYFRRYAKPDKQNLFFDIAKNEFFRALAEIVSHEYRHIFQNLSAKGIGVGETSPSSSDKSWVSYYKSHEELDAFALQAAVQYLRHGESNIISNYDYHFSEKDPKTWRKFLKKFYMNVKELKKRGLEKYIRLN
jgi:hypothetical protein